MDSLRRRLAAPAHNPTLAGEHWFVRMRGQGFWQSAPGLMFLILPAYFVLFQPSSTAAKLTSMGLLVLVGALYGIVTLAVEWRFVPRVVLLVALTASIAAFGLSTHYPRNAVYLGVYVAVVIALTIPFDIALYLIATLSIILFAVSALAPVDFVGLGMGAAAAMVGFSIMSGLESDRRQWVEQEEQERNATLAVALERERIGRDLHDILGHSLTAVAVKADLAERLIGVDADKARDQIAELRTIARQALADVRATASGLQTVRLATEITSARSVLEAADIEATTPVALPAFDDATSETLGYVVREAVTNVVRHSGATRCTIDVGDDEVSVHDDGHGIRGAEGRGLAGLRSRAKGWGEVAVETSASGTTVRVTRRTA